MPTMTASPIATSLATPALSGIQGTFDDLGTPLVDVTFVVVDLETTGGSAALCQITEIGAVKVRGGQVIGEFHSLVNPGEPIPAFIAVLTGITDATVANAPAIGLVLPAFLEFAHDAVLVAHNAPFDIGFLKAACERQGIRWPAHAVLDTARIARRTLDRDEAPNCKLATLARLFRATTMPTHRALDDARATVDVLHGLFERLGCHGVTTLEDIDTFSTRVSGAQRRKRYLADGVPTGPGVYLFPTLSNAFSMLANQSICAHASSSTSQHPKPDAAWQRWLLSQKRLSPCRAPLPSRPKYANCPDRRVQTAVQPAFPIPGKVCLPQAHGRVFPRLSIVRQVRDDNTTYLGPFRNARLAEAAATALLEAFPLRQCTRRLARTGGGSACLLAEMGRCGAPCEGLESPDDYSLHVAAATHAMLFDPRPVVQSNLRRMAPKVASERFEEAVAIRDRLQVLLHGSARAQRLRALGGCAEMVAARPDFQGGWEITIIRHGRLAGAGLAMRGVAVVPFVQSLSAGAELVAAAPASFPAATSEETERLLRWLDSGGVRLVALDGQWASPRHGAGGLQSRLSLELVPADPAPGAAR